MKVLFDHDGGVDDLLSLMLLLTYKHVDMLGVSIVPADCYLKPAVESCQRILSWFNRTDVEVAGGGLNGPNPFPPEWRAQPKIINGLPELLRTQPEKVKVSGKSAHEFIVDKLSQSTEKVTILCTGPLSNIAKAIEIMPEIIQKIDNIFWMGGAINTRGNVAMHDHDGTAEWNAYYDPMAVKKVFESQVSITLVPLDATDAVPVSNEFLEKLAKQNHRLCDLACQCWATTICALPSYEYTYHLWDVLTTSVLGLPEDHFKLNQAEFFCDTDTPSAGRVGVHDSQTNGFHRWIEKVDGTIIYDFVIAQLCSYNKT